MWILSNREISGHSIVVVRVIWDHLVSVRFRVPRQKKWKLDSVLRTEHILVDNLFEDTGYDTKDISFGFAHTPIRDFLA